MNMKKSIKSLLQESVRLVESWENKTETLALKTVNKLVAKSFRQNN